MTPEELKAKLAQKNAQPAQPTPAPVDFLDAPLHEDPAAPEDCERDELLEKAADSIQYLQECLLEDKPELKSAVQMINDQMRQFPELVYLLSDEQIAPVYQARMKLSRVEITVSKSKKGGKKGLLPDGSSLGDLL